MTTSDDATRSIPTQQAYQPLPGSVLVTAALGGTLRSGAATLTFAPGSLRTDAWVTIDSHQGSVDGLHTTSAIYDLQAVDARTGAVISTFDLAPILTIAVGSTGPVSAIYYLAADGSVQRQATTYDPATGVVSAALPHFSSYVSGSPLDGLVALLVPQITSWIASLPPTFPATYTFVTAYLLAPGVTLSSVTLTLDAAISGATGSYTGSISISGSVTLDLAVGSVRLQGTGLLVATYALSSQAVDRGTLTLAVTGFGLTVSSGGTAVGSIAAGTAVLTQTGSDLTFAATGVTLTMGSLTVGAGALTLTSHGSTGALDFLITGGTVTLTGATITAATVVYTGAAGLTVAGTLSLAVAGQTLTGAVVVTNDGSALTLTVADLTVSLGTAAQSVVLTAGAGQLVRTSSGLVGSLTGSVAATGVISGTGTGSLFVDTTATTPSVTVLVALRDISLTVAQGGAGLVVANATVGLFVQSAGGRTDYALDAQGDVSLVGIPDVAASGHLRARVNSFTTAVSRSAAFADGTGSVDLLFTDGTGATAVETGTSTTAFSSYAGTGLTLSVLGQTLTADVVVALSTTGLTVEIANLSFDLQGQGTTVAHFAQTGAAGSLTLGASAASGTLTGTLTLTVPGLSVTGTIALDVLTSSVAADPHHLTLTGSNVSLVVAGQSLQVWTLGLSRVTTGGVTITTVSLTGGSFTLTQGSTTLLTVSGISGSVAVTSAGLSGHLQATVTTGLTGITFGTTVTLGVNTGAAAVGDLPGGPYLRVEASGTTITVGGQTLTADLVVVRGVDAAGATELRVAVANATLTLNAGVTTVVAVTGGTGALVVGAAGFAAQVQGVVTVSVPGVELSGSLSLYLNTTGTAVDDSVRVGDSDVPVAVPAGAGPYLRLVGTGITLTVAGQALTGDITVEKSAGTVTVSVPNATLTIGSGLVSVTGASASFTAGSTGLVGTFTGTVAVSVPGVVLSGTVTAQVNTSATAQSGIPAGSLRIGGSSITVTVGGVALTGEIWFERVAGSGGASTYRLELVNAGVALGTYVVISAVSGTVQMTSAGLAGSLTATATFAIPTLLNGSVAVALQVNTTPAPAVLSPTVTLPAGPYVRVALDNADLTIGTLGRVTGSLAFQRSLAPGGVTETLVAMTGVTAYLGSSTSASLYNGTGALVMRSDGVAGYLSGTATASTAGIQMSGSVLLQVNTTGTIVDTSIVVGGATLSIKFPTAAQVFSLSVSNASLTIADFVTVEGSVTFSDTSLTLGGSAVQAQVFAGTGLTLFLGRGPARLDTGALNPLAVGILLTDARIGLISVAGGYALVATGTVSLVGVTGVTITGVTSVQVNTTGYVIDQTLDVPGSSDPGVAVQFAASTPVTRFQVTGATLAFGDLSLTGGLSFSRDGTDVVATLDDAAVALGSAVTVTALTGTIHFGSSGVAASLAAHIAVAALGLDVDGQLLLNTTAAPVTLTVGPGTVDLPAGPYLRAEVTGATLSILGQSISADVAVERATAADGSVTTRIGLADVALTLTAGSTSTQTVGITHGAGLLVIGPSGLAGRVSGDVTSTLGSDVSLTGTLSLAVNTTAAAVNTSLTVGGVTQELVLAAGPYVRFEGVGITITVLGQTITGDVAVEKATARTAAGVPDPTRSVLRIAATNVRLTLGGAQPVVSLTDGTAVLLLTGTAVAGRITGTLAVTLPGVALTGALAVELNTGTAEVNETFSVGSAVPVVLTLPPATGGAYVQVRGTGVSLTILGQTLSGDVTIARTVVGGTPTLTITTANLALRLGGSSGSALLTATQVTGTTGTFTVAAGALSGSIAVAVTVAVPNVALTGSIAVTFNTANGTFTLAGTGLTLTAFGQSLGGDFVIDQQLDAAGAKVVRLAVANATLDLGPVGSPVFSAQSGSGAFVITGAGVAGTLAATVSVGSGTPVSVTGTVQVQINTTGSAVDELVTVGAGAIAIQLPAGPYLRIAGTGVTLTVGTQALQADIAVERTTSLRGGRRGGYLRRLQPRAHRRDQRHPLAR